MNILLAFLFIAVYGCSREEVPEETGSGNEDYTSLLVDGVYLIDDTDGGGYISASNLALISGDFDNATLILSIANVTAPGTFILSSSDDASYQINSPFENYNLDNPGSHLTVVITEIYPGTLKGLKGTFEGELYNDAGDFITITDGQFEDH